MLQVLNHVLLLLYTHALEIQCRVIIQLYIMDHEDLGFSGQTYHPKTSLTIPLWHLGSIGEV